MESANYLFIFTTITLMALMIFFNENIVPLLLLKCEIRNIKGYLLIILIIISANTSESHDAIYMNNIKCCGQHLTFLMVYWQENWPFVKDPLLMR